MTTVNRQRRELLYRGRVQGVGFRFTTNEIARRYDVAGYVENLPDGRVRLVAEGEPDELQRFIDAVAAELGRYIVDASDETTAAQGEFSDFSIRR